MAEITAYRVQDQLFGIGDLFDLYYEKGLSFEDLREIASDRI